MKNSVCPKAKVIRRPNFFRKPNLSEYLPNVPKCGLNTRHDNREVTLIHLTRAQSFALWQMRPPVQSTQNGSNDYQRYSMLTVLPLRVYVLYPRQFIIAPSCRRRPFLAGITIHWALRSIFWNIFFWISNDNKCLWWKHVLTQKNYKNFESDSGNEE